MQLIPPEPLLWGAVAVVTVQRLGELVVTERNRRRLLAQGAIQAPRDGWGAFVAIHAGLLVAWPLEALVAPWARTGPWTLVLLGVAGAAMALRYWAASSLGVRYVTRVLRLPHAPLVHRGPYRWMRHPIYCAVAIEVVALPLAFGALVTTFLLGLANVATLAYRIRIEESFLGLRDIPTT